MNKYIIPTPSENVFYRKLNDIVPLNIKTISMIESKEQYKDQLFENEKQRMELDKKLKVLQAEIDGLEEIKQKKIDESLNIENEKKSLEFELNNLMEEKIILEQAENSLKKDVEIKREEFKKLELILLKTDENLDQDRKKLFDIDNLLENLENNIKQLEIDLAENENALRIMEIETQIIEAVCNFNLSYNIKYFYI